MTIPTVPVLSWFTGKGRERASEALKNLQDSLNQGYWQTGVSRSTRAALSKHNVASNYARGLVKTLDYKSQAYKVAFAMVYGVDEHLMLVDVPILVTECANRNDLNRMPTFLGDFLPIMQAMHELDSRRPPPIFTSIGVSPTLTRTLSDLGVEASPETVAPCPSEWRLEERVDSKGRKFNVFVGYLLWPEGTAHNVSRHAHGEKGGSKCHACGHGIRNDGNWVPLVLTDRSGKPLSLWVGRDCARSLFGVDMRGEAEWSRDQHPFV